MNEPAMAALLAPPIAKYLKEISVGPNSVVNEEAEPPRTTNC
jgi:hypothetical protein